MQNATFHGDDFHLAQECLEGKTSALTYLQESYREPLTAFLQERGAQPQDAAEIVSELWSHCVTPPSGSVPKLARYNGMCALKTFLSAVALNEAVDMQRKKKRRPVPIPVEILAGPNESDAREPGEPADPSRSAETQLLDLMREAIEAAFRACPADDFVLLQLAHVDGLHVAELAKMFGSSTSSVSRTIGKACERVADATLQNVRATDPWLELTWNDFLDLCRAASPACFGIE